MKEIQDITLSALVTAILFINMLVFDFLSSGEGVLNQYNAYLLSSTFLVGVIYIRLRMIGLDLEDVQKQLKNPENPVVDDVVSVRSTVESLKDEITTRLDSVVGLKSEVDDLDREVSNMHAELKEEVDYLKSDISDMHADLKDRLVYLVDTLAGR